MNPYIEGKEKKKIIKITVGALLAVIAVFIVTTVGSNLASSGVIGIRSLEELEKIGRQEGYPLDGAYILEQDIDGDGKTIAAIGSRDKPFAGHFDGQGHTIRNVTVEAEEVREIRTREIRKAAPDGEETAEIEQDGEKEKNADGSVGKADENTAGEKDVRQETMEQVKLTVSADGYPVFEYTTKEKQDQIENLCLDGVKAVVKLKSNEDKQRTEEKQKAEKEQTEDGTAQKNTEGQNVKNPVRESASEKEKPVVKIHTWEEFKNIGNTKYNPVYTMDADYVLADAIKSDGKKFTPIGTEENPFTGTFDGGGKKIDVSANPEINTNAAYNGLFGTVKNKGGGEDGR